jgi:putative ABC transport system substrate-binding protein
VLLRPGTTVFDFEVEEAKKAKLLIIKAEYKTKAGRMVTLEDAFAEAAEKRVGGLLVCADPFFTSRRKEIVALAAEHQLPTAYPFREYVDVGGLMSFGPDLRNAYRQIGLYAAMILRDRKPVDLPVLTTTSFRLAINISTAQDLDLVVPLELLRARADDVIETHAIRS